MLPLDLHVLGMPPAFNLSQDQTLQLIARSYQISEMNPDHELTSSKSRTLIDQWVAYQPDDASAHTSYLIVLLKSGPGEAPRQTDHYTGHIYPVNG